MLRRLNQTFPERYPFLLQSTAHSGALGRFDILFANPGENLVLESPGNLRGSARCRGAGFLQALDDWWRHERIPDEQRELPFLGGWFLYLGYELAAEIEPHLSLHVDPVLPTGFAVRCPNALVYDHTNGLCSFVSETADSDDGVRVQAEIEYARDTTMSNHAVEFRVIEEPPDKFIQAVGEVKQYIANGDIYQANLSRQWIASVREDQSAGHIYASLVRANPAPFAGIVHWQDVSIISSSPERLIEVRNGMVATRPIAGTRPRGASTVTDIDLLAELIADPKERAEHVMLIDLERNDLGRIAVAGSVEVNEMMVLESYEHVHHIVSNVRGQLRADVTPGQAIAAVFPGGTITGCPKVRCMEIIDELENCPRGAYTGSFGYLNRDGSMDLNILIRTMVKRGSEIRFRAGGGIVADSEPLAELQETRAKSKGLLRAFAND
jgi:anthranilate synthase component 1